MVARPDRPFLEEAPSSAGMGQIYKGRERAASAPVAYEQRGGMALASGPAQAAHFYEAADRARQADARRRQAFLDRKKAFEMQQVAIAKKQEAENLRSGIVGATSLADDATRRIVGASKRESSSGDLGKDFKWLLEGGFIKQAPSGDYRFTPQGMFGLFHGTDSPLFSGSSLLGPVRDG